MLLDQATSVPGWIFINIVSGIGFGCLFSGLSIASQAPQSEENMALATGLSPFFRALGQAFGIAIGDAVYQNTLKMYLRNAKSPVLQQQASVLAKNSANIVIILRGMPGESAERTELLAAFNKSLHAIWWCFVGFALLGGLLSCLIRHVDLGRRKTSEAGVGLTDLEKAANGDGSANGGVRGATSQPETVSGPGTAVSTDWMVVSR